jgi:hypothetical protein
MASKIRWFFEFAFRRPRDAPSSTHTILDRLECTKFINTKMQLTLWEFEESWKSFAFAHCKKGADTVYSRRNIAHLDRVILINACAGMLRLGC